MTVSNTFKNSSKLLLLLVAAFPLTGLAAASLDFVIGDVQAVSASGGTRSLGKGGRIVAGDTVRVGDGRAQLRFDDGAMVSLQPNTDFRIDDYQFSGQQDGKERGFFSLLRGGLRTLTGLVGKVNKGNYKVTTSVATIGIRGTEYTLTYLDSETVVIATGEGAIEVCNGSGCTVLVSGDSAVVEGPKAAPKRVDFRPQLRPAQPGEQLLPQFSSSEFRNQDGSLLLNGNQLTSGAGYALAWAHGANGGLAPNASTVFGSSSQLIVASNSNGTFYGQTLGESASADGVIGWGRWSTGTSVVVPPASGGGPLTNFHYVVGRETALSQLSALSGITATYQLIGYTTPTASTGSSTGPVTGTLTASFGAATMNVSMALQVPYSNVNYAINASTGTVPVSSTFTWASGSTGAGFFSGPNASHAGASYNNYVGGNNISGTAAFKR